MSKKVKGTAIGIDLGTTYSCAAIWLSRKKRVEIIPNEQGNRITPSCVAFSDSELLVGESAKNQIARNPANTVFGKIFLFKRFMQLFYAFIFSEILVANHNRSKNFRC